ncbi:MAG: CHAD domain-containing protein [Gammaproteobacteria bacterium]|nr:CHAD domain-containing protein [Gammaproteobacteria bacterium]MBU1655794.1 CHAD domain-containing protein [Gammaproteobacteria bacterium]MBU1960049.1 CHAD domain-containing protein [Gammaproteobacteria bacterium]
MPFLLSSISSDVLLRDLADRWRLSEGLGRRVEGVFFDTFDWRLYLGGLVLFVDRDGAEWVWLLMGRAAGDVLALCRGDGAPGMAATLPEPLRNRLAPLLEMRRLLPQVALSGELRSLNLLNEDEKTVLRLDLLECRVVGEQGQETGLPTQLKVSPLRGYEDDASCLEQWLRGLAISEGCLLDEALAVVGKRGGSYSSKLQFSLHPGEGADEATRHILLHLLGTIEANVAGVCNDLDSEFLHDLRVAVRRTRSALTQIKEVFEPDGVERFKADFAWLGQITGPTRDLDVYLLKFPGYLESLQGGFRDALEPFHRYLVQHRATEQAILANHLRSEPFQVMLRDWRAFLESPPADPSPANAARPVKEVAGARIHKLYRRVMKEGRAIGEESPAEALHELRKSCKKLRYLMEFFQSLYPAARVDGLIKALKILLDNLGDHQDLQVQAEKLVTMASDMRRSKAGTHCLLALGMLIGGLLLRQRGERERFATVFAQFNQERNRERFAALFLDNTLSNQ